MRSFLAVLIALGSFAAVAGDADAQRSRYYAPEPYREYAPPPPPYAYQPPPPGYGYREAERSDSMDCIEARNLDPGGNYEDYPCWARRALAPKKDR